MYAESAGLTASLMHACIYMFIANKFCYGYIWHEAQACLLQPTMALDCDALGDMRNAFVNNKQSCIYAMLGAIVAACHCTLPMIS